MNVIALYSAVLVLWLVALSCRVIALRGSPMLGWMVRVKDRERALKRAIRGHGNLIEYAPMFVLSLLIGQRLGLEDLWIHVYGGSFLVGRLIHGWLFSFMNKPNVPLRIGGMTLTLLPLTAVAVHAAALALG